MAHISRQAAKRKRQRAYFRGRVAELMAAFCLRLKGYHIVARDYRKPFGEIDIIARRGRLLVAVEVKSRQTRDAALLAVSSKQRRRIRNALEAFVTEKPKFRDFDMRFDVVTVVSFFRWPEHLESAWD